MIPWTELYYRRWNTRIMHQDNWNIHFCKSPNWSVAEGWFYPHNIRDIKKALPPCPDWTHYTWLVQSNQKPQDLQWGPGIQTKIVSWNVFTHISVNTVLLACQHEFDLHILQACTTHEVIISLKIWAPNSFWFFEIEYIENGSEIEKVLTKSVDFAVWPSPDPTVLLSLAATCRWILSTCGLWFDWFEHLPLDFEHLRFEIRLIWALAVGFLSTCGLWFDWFEHLPLDFEHLRFVIRLIWALAVGFWALAVCDSIDLSTCGLWFDWFEHLPLGFWALAICDSIDLSTCRWILSTCDLWFDWFEHLPLDFEHLRFVIRLIWALAVGFWALAICDSIDLSTCRWILSTCGLWFDWFEHLPLDFEHLRFVIRLIWALAVGFWALAICDSIDLSTCRWILSTCDLWFDWFEHLPLDFEHLRFVIWLIWALAVGFWALADLWFDDLSTCRWILSTCGLWFDWFEHLPLDFEHLRFVIRLIWALAVGFWALAICDSIDLSTCRLIWALAVWILSTCGLWFDWFEHLPLDFEHLRFVIRLIWALAVGFWALAVCDSIDLSTCRWILSTCGLWFDWFEHLPLDFEHLRFVIRLIWALAIGFWALWFDWFEHLPLDL